jgi:hypothetical protein
MMDKKVVAIVENDPSMLKGLGGHFRSIKEN